MPRTKLPLVAICGRPNVGKSTLFNRITGKARAIVHDQPGVTRDRTYAKAEWQGRHFRVVDTGGMVDDATDSITRKMQSQVRAALQEAAVIIFVVDGQAGITRMDEEVKEMLFRLGKPVVLAVNKLDNPKLEENRYDFFQLGLGDPFPISSGHGRGVDDMMQAVLEHLPKVSAEQPVPEEAAEARVKVAIVGKPNVGKSSFINAILNEERAIVDATPGTTRDALDVEFDWQGKHYLLIDTAGMRRKAGIREAVEHYSIARSLRAINRADVCCIMLDAGEGVSEQDKRILGYCVEQGTAMVLVWTKWDLIEDKEARFKELREELEYKVPQLRYVPSVTISNTARTRIYDVFKLVDRVAAEAHKRVGTSELNRFIEEIKGMHAPPTKRGKAAKILYGTQASVKPTTFVLFVNQASLFHFTYLRFIENQLRARYGFEGVPIKLELREGKPRE